MSTLQPGPSSSAHWVAAGGGGGDYQTPATSAGIGGNKGISGGPYGGAGNGGWRDGLTGQGTSAQENSGSGGGGGGGGSQSPGGNGGSGIIIIAYPT
jgi:hypothetical protein